MSAWKRRFSKIMLAVDGSETSMKAADDALDIAALVQAKEDNYDDDHDNKKVLVIGLTVIDLTRLSYSFFIPAPTYGLKELEEKKKEAEQWLANIDELAKVKNVQFRSEIIEDPISKVGAIIVNYAESENVDLIVLGTRGRSRFKKLLLGSVASDVMHYAHCTVMVVK